MAVGEGSEERSSLLHPPSTTSCRRPISELRSAEVTQMKRYLFLAVFFLSVTFFANVFAQEKKGPELQVKADIAFLKPPDGVYFGECVGVALDSKGNRLHPEQAR